ncbi:hypothetical protein JMJ77_0007890 [Colletotrichum scovillei]|uniref:Uncharacterized protein n=1 Tax=Colletotrichum scovillei TaxID=1209932 RepID=A0A9P7RDP9_9PEZI|nr:hypothetical protein JMJ77_0007890 [Colletotrichum scovillei]KAG7074875.1 hypothetical protein JMJ76_0011343 [Colletotrichum scovillei]KAG7081975.1 hypothetical protein JMJ78_0004084 [Colletotrichum scovillei]
MLPPPSPIRDNLPYTTPHLHPTASRASHTSIFAKHRATTCEARAVARNPSSIPFFIPRNN